MPSSPLTGTHAWTNAHASENPVAQTSDIVWFTMSLDGGVATTEAGPRESARSARTTLAIRERTPCGTHRPGAATLSTAATSRSCSDPGECGLSDWGDGGFGGAVGVGDVQGAVGFDDQSDFRVVRRSVMVVFAHQTAVAGGVEAAVFSEMHVVHVAVDRLLVAAGPAAVLITRRDRPEQGVGDRWRASFRSCGSPRPRRGRVAGAGRCRRGLRRLGGRCGAR